MHLRPSPTAAIVVEPVEIRAELADVLRGWLARSDAVVLDSSQSGSPDGRFTILTADPVETLRVEAWERGRDVVGELAARVGQCPLAAGSTCEVPFLGGWIGFLGYEWGTLHEGVSTRKAADPWLPSAQFNLYDTAAVFDTTRGRWSIVAVEWPAGVHTERGSAASRVARFRRWLFGAVELPELRCMRDIHCSRSSGTLQAQIGNLDRGEKEAPGNSGITPRTPAESGTAPLRSGLCLQRREPCRPNAGRDAYLRLARRVQEYIAAGDVYQVNLSMRFTARTDATPQELYLRLRAVNPAPYAAYFPTEHATILCSSPELFLDVRGQQVRTRPIKGTRPRTGEEESDETAQTELLHDEKERAELAMIVDLLRNDLGRVCEFGSVRVDDPGTIEAHPTVFHRVATITGRLRGNRTWADLLRSTFPGGSITGAPKIRAMQIINELEPTPRGVYCGAIGWVGLDGSMRFNVAIRTMVQVGQQVHVYAGGAVTADSDPEKEYAEILAKAAGMFRALGCTAPSETPGIEVGPIESPRIDFPPMRDRSIVAQPASCAPKAVKA